MAKGKKTKPGETPWHVPMDKRTFETFREIRAYDVRNLQWHEPSAFNGDVSVVRYLVTIEEVVEAPEVIHARLQKLWDACDNHHNWAPLRVAAARHGYTMKGEPGTARRK